MLQLLTERDPHQLLVLQDKVLREASQVWLNDSVAPAGQVV